jgi:hypothetical protein
MTAPTFRAGSPQTTIDDTDGTTFTATLPTHEPGDFLYIWIAADGEITITAPAGWTQVQLRAHPTTVTGAFFKKDVATTGSTSGGTPDSNPVFTLGASQSATSLAWAIHGTSIEVESTTGTNGSATNADPPSLTCSTSADWLFGALYAGDGQSGPSVAPSGYSNLINNQSGVSTGASSGAAYKSTTASTGDNPGTFTNPTDQWVAVTVAWRDSAAPPAATNHAPRISMMGVG